VVEAGKLIHGGKKKEEEEKGVFLKVGVLSEEILPFEEAGGGPVLHRTEEKKKRKRNGLFASRCTAFESQLQATVLEKGGKNETPTKQRRWLSQARKRKNGVAPDRPMKRTIHRVRGNRKGGWANGDCPPDWGEGEKRKDTNLFLRHSKS